MLDPEIKTISHLEWVEKSFCAGPRDQNDFLDRVD